MNMVALEKNPYKMAQEALKLIDNSLPVDIELIAEKQSISVILEDLDEEISGMLVVTDNNKTICINKNHPHTRQRFTIAHELGHYFMHVEDGEESIIFVDEAVYHRNGISSEGTEIKEIEANSFAAELLMPKELLLEKINNYSVINDQLIEELAEEFDVSIRAMTIRLARLKLISLH